MSASLARTVFRPTTRTTSQCPARYFYRDAARSSKTEEERNVNLMAHLAVLATLVVSAQYYLSHPDTLMFDHPPRSAIGWPPSKQLAYRQGFASSTTSISSTPSSPQAPSLALRSISKPTLSSPSTPSYGSSSFETFGQILAGIAGKN